MTAQLLKEIIPEDQEIVCFDGKNLGLLAALREFFISYNLTVVDNSEATTHCLYWIICGTAIEIKAIADTKRKTAKGTILIIRNETIEKAERLAAQLNAKCARITDKNLTPADARVVFGLLFSETESVVTISDSRSPSPGLKPPPVSKESIRNSDTSHTSWEETEKQISELIQQTYQKSTPVRRNTSLLLRLLRVSVYAVFLVVSVHVLFFFLTLHGLSQLQQSFRHLHATRLSASATRATGTLLSLPFQVVSIDSPYLSMLRIIHRAEDILLVLEKNKNKSFIDSSVLSGANSFLQTIHDAQSVSAEILPDILLIEAEIKHLRQHYPILGQSDYFSRHLDRTEVFLTTIKEAGSLLYSFSQVLSLFIDSTDQKTYLLLFQNNRELRPTGGFIGSVGYLTVKDGRVHSFDIQDVYEIDGQLRGHVDPPLPIRTLLQQEHWYTRDSNWSPDFPESAEQALWFLDKSLGLKADGVIAVSLPVLEELLEITGPLNIPELNQSVSADSVFEFIYQSTRADFFPGSTAKKDALVRLSEVLKGKLSGMDTQQLFQLGSFFVSQLQQKNILFFSRDQRAQKEIVFRGMSGAFPPSVVCPSDREAYCVRDVLAVAEANLGLNKTNSAVGRGYARSVEFLDTELKRIDTLTYTNTATAETVAGGTYRSYLRIYYPVGTTIQTIRLNNEPLSITSATSSAKPVPYTEIIDEVEGLLTLGVAIDVPESQQTILEIHSTQSFASAVRAYSLGVFKHPGVEESDFSLSVSSPPGYRINDLVANSQEVSYNSKLRRDENIIVAFDPEVQ